MGFWIVALLTTILLLYVLRGILLPFVAGFALAYLLDPLADRLQRLGIGRLGATLIILILFVLLFIVALMLLVPLLGASVRRVRRPAAGLCGAPAGAGRRAGRAARRAPRRRRCASRTCRDRSATSSGKGSAWSATSCVPYGRAARPSSACSRSSSSRRSSPSICSWTGTAWSPPSMAGCRFSTAKPCARSRATSTPRSPASSAGRRWSASSSARSMRSACPWSA